MLIKCYELDFTYMTLSLGRVDTALRFKTSCRFNYISFLYRFYTMVLRASNVAQLQKKIYLE